MTNPTETPIQPDADFDAMHADMERRGWVDIPEANGVRPGSRVHHSGQQYPEAREAGTAVVLAVMEKNPSHWSNTYGRRDIEVIVRSDKPFLRGMSTVSTWADYHTRLVTS